MNQFMNAVVKGVAVGAAVGTAAYMMKPKHSRSKIIKRNATKAVKTLGNVMENVAYMIK